MVARSVGGVAVTHIRQAKSDKVAHSVFEDPEKVSTIRGVAELTLADGSKVYGCTSCDEYTSESLRAVISHMGGRHPGESVRSPGEGRSTVATGVTLREAIRAVSELRQTRRRLVSWQRRALAAERDLKAARQQVRALSRSR